MRYPLDDALGGSYLQVVQRTPLPAYPFAHSSPLLQAVFPRPFYEASLGVAWPLSFSLAYYLIAKSANALLRDDKAPRDWTRGKGAWSTLLRAFIVLHNALLCAYSLATFLLMAPVVADLFWQGYAAAGHEGVKLALCAMPTNHAYLGRWAYLFYLSKYYEVIDSLVLYLKGRAIGNLQSYHHAGALLAMWVAYRFQSTPVWVFCVFNSAVHTAMYAYYLCSAMRWPFPKALKRNLTTLQIAQIASGTLLTNVYFFLLLDPIRLAAAFARTPTSTLLPASLFASASSTSLANASAASKPWTLAARLFGRKAAAAVAAADAVPNEMLLSTYARARLATSDASVCLDRQGAALALHANTLYMIPLLVLFARFFIRAYLAPSKAKTRKELEQGNMNGQKKVI
ncbi:hypothetical protein FA10DRAFT_302328 [Acaromyces ingoldii]|uniref:Elongation of fatty acids protein n=1 Tax=Acaromyces ingoldii TaxID=215250 RepID=A0A316YHA8_9BASI|nr:hypothetical protein FA10DRAFT_302328 [Acaromyces ingoldii]PWN88930.1 hypothetical protein FA10DRAFT_302328 [Acaromyces ingoldii]